MRKVYLLSLLFIGIVFSVVAFAQDTASVTWKLTKPDTTEVSSTVGPIVGYKESFSNLYVTIYNGPVGPIDSSQKVCMTIWPYATKYDTSTYIQFAVSPATGTNLKITNVTIPCGAHGGSNQTIEIFYSIDGFATSVKLNSASIGLGKDIFTDPPPSFNINVPVASGKTFAVRVYPWLKSSSGSQTGKYVCLQNVVISGTTVTGVNDKYTTLDKFELLQNYPNPFNPTTLIGFTVPVSGIVSLSVYNLLGEKVAAIVNERMEKGVYEKSFNGNNLATGVYIYRLTLDNFTLSKKMMLMK
jgi:Secretion system C-terminal sorting domain